MSNGVGGAHEHGPTRGYQNHAGVWVRQDIAENSTFVRGQMGRNGDPDPFQVRGLYPQLSRYSADLKQITAACLNVDPAHRPTMSELNARIVNYINANPAVDNWVDPGPIMIKREDVFALGQVMDSS